MMKLHIAEPCHENWNEMTPNEQGRFCAHCQKTVIDFTKMTDSEIIAFFEQNATKKICGSFMPAQLEKEYAFKSSQTPLISKYQKAFSSVAATILLLGISACNISPVMGKVATVSHQQEQVYQDSKEENTDIPRVMIRGQVIDKNTGKPVANVVVRCKSYQETTTTDADGYFSLGLPENVGKQIMLEILSADNIKENTFYAIQQEDFGKLHTIQVKSKVCTAPTNHQKPLKGKVQPIRKVGMVVPMPPNKNR